jgi:ferredoxin-NADP reductase
MSWDVEYLGKVQVAESIKSFRFERPEDFVYLPGQFFFIEIQEGDGVLTHHFTLSSSPSEPFLQFTTIMTGSPFKNAMDNQSKGARVNVRGPLGNFIIEDGMKKVAYLCGGIGVTPARSSLRWAADTDAALDIILVHGVRTLAGTPFKDEMEELKNEKISVVHVLSRPEVEWKGPTGHIDKKLIESSIPYLKDRTFFVSGPPGMVDDFRKMLIRDVSIPLEKIKVENFTGY